MHPRAKKVLATGAGICHALPMFKRTYTYHYIEADKNHPHQFEKKFKKILDTLLNPDYVRAVEKIAKIYSKQNYLYN
jgi:hypothetical protein